MDVIPGAGRSPGVGNGNPLQYSCLENPPGERSLTDYSPWGGRESNMTEHTHTHTQLLYECIADQTWKCHGKPGAS